MRVLFLILLFFIFNPSFAQNYSQIKSDLERFVDQNMQIRQSVMPIVNNYGFKSEPMDSLNQLIQKQDSIHLSYVISIVENYGWLGISQIGKKANSSLFLAIQHAQNNELRTQYFPFLEASATKGESSLIDMATMKDRILIAQNEPQIFGTQSWQSNGEMILFPIFEDSLVNIRRKKVGLENLTEEQIIRSKTTD